ncbi:MAG: lactate utilization protein C [Terracidiphilus sp.]|jgi:L-lactate dehydrogenase complex protein LldG
MSAPSSRATGLDRIHAATRNSAATAAQAAGEYAGLTRDYVMRGKLTVSACHERFVERLREYDAEVVECAPEGLADAIRAQLAASGRRKFVVPEGLPAEWLAEGFEWKIDRGLTAQDVEQAEGVVTACFCGVAESGTIVLHHSAAEGRRVISLLPDWHLCVVRASQIVETLPEYFARYEEPPRLVTWISGPSATADIEMTRIKGVHGPRFLNVIVVKDKDQGLGD